MCGGRICKGFLGGIIGLVDKGPVGVHGRRKKGRKYSKVN